VEAAVWDLAPAEAEGVAVRVVAQVGAAARAALEVCGRPANRALQRAVAREAVALAQAALVVEAETAVVREDRVADPVEADPVEAVRLVVGLAAEAALAVVALAVVGLVVEAAAQAALVLRVSQESGWQRLQC